nr:IMV membrane protein [Wadden Sea poxvirus]
MDMMNTIGSYFTGILISGIVLISVACIFAFVDFSKNKQATNYTWRALCVISFILGIIITVGILIYSTYGRYCIPGKIVLDSARYNRSDIELNSQ